MSDIWIENMKTSSAVCQLFWVKPRKKKETGVVGFLLLLLFLENFCANFLCVLTPYRLFACKTKFLRVDLCIDSFRFLLQRRLSCCFNNFERRNFTNPAGTMWVNFSFHCLQTSLLVLKAPRSRTLDLFYLCITHSELKKQSGSETCSIPCLQEVDGCQAICTKPSEIKKINKYIYVIILLKIMDDVVASGVWQIIILLLF